MTTSTPGGKPPPKRPFSNLPNAHEYDIFKEKKKTKTKAKKYDYRGRIIHEDYEDIPLVNIIKTPSGKTFQSKQKRFLNQPPDIYGNLSETYDDVDPDLLERLYRSEKSSPEKIPESQKRINASPPKKKLKGQEPSSKEPLIIDLNAAIEAPNSLIEIVEDEDPNQMFEDYNFPSMFTDADERYIEHSVIAPQDVYSKDRKAMITQKTQHHFKWVEDIIFSAFLKYDVSEPQGNFHYATYEFDVHPQTQLTLETSLQIHTESGLSVIHSLAQESLRSFLNFSSTTLIFFCFRIEAKRFTYEPHLLNEITVTSNIFQCLIEDMLNDCAQKFREYCNFLSTRGGGGGDPNEPRHYDQWFHEDYHIYDITKITLTTWKFSMGGGCGTATLPAREMAGLLKTSNLRDNLCFWETLLHNPKMFQLQDIHGNYKTVDIVDYFDILNQPRQTPLTIEQKCQVLKVSAGFGKTEHWNLMVYFDQIPDICKNLKINIDVMIIISKSAANGLSANPRHLAYKHLVPEKCNRMIYLCPEDKYREPDYKEGDHIYTIVYYQRNTIGHYYALGIKDDEQVTPDKLLNMVSCATCYTWFDKRTNVYESHKQCFKCTQCGKKHSPLDKCVAENHLILKPSPLNLEKYPKLNKIKIPKLYKEPHWFSPGGENIFFADFETFGDYYQPQRTYSIACCNIMAILNYNTQIIDLNRIDCDKYWGLNGMKLFVDFLIDECQKKPTTVVFFNGSRFDYLFTIKELISRKYKDFEFQKNPKNGGYDIFKIGKKINFMDMRKFIGGSLAGCCEAYGVPKEYIKKDFNHNKIKTYTDCCKHKDEIIDYNKYDVIALGILYIKYQESLWKSTVIKTKHRIKDCVSGSHLAYTICLQSMPRDYTLKLKCPVGLDHNFIRRALYGGRTATFINSYYHDLCKTIQWKNINTYTDGQRIQIYERNINTDNVIVYYDYTSLYPDVSRASLHFGGLTVLTERDFEGYYITMEKLFQWTETNKYPPDKTLCDLISRSFIETDVVCPKNLRIPFLDARSENGTLLWNLEDKKNQVYDGESILFAARFGYKFRFIRGVRFSESAPIFKEFMETMFKFKNDAKKEGNMILSNQYKSFMNDSTGKNSQQPVDSKSTLYYDDTFLENIDINKLLHITDFWSGNNVHAFYVKTRKDNPEIYSKPVHLGCYILALARIKMWTTMAYLGFVTDEDVGNEPYKVPFYTDTDSMMMLGKWINHADIRVGKEMGITLGNDLGQFKNETPEVAWFCGVWPAKKVYAMLGINDKGRICYMIKTKGAPCVSEFCNKDPKLGYYYMDELLKLDDNKNLEKLFEKGLEEDLKVVYFLFTDDAGNVKDRRLYIPFEWMEKWNSSQHNIVVRFNSLKKYLSNPLQEESYLVIQKINAQRNINHNRSWVKAEQRCLSDNGKNSLPAGHPKFIENKMWSHRYWDFVEFALVKSDKWGSNIPMRVLLNAMEEKSKKLNLNKSPI